MWDWIIVAVIVALAAFFVVRRFWRTAKGTGQSCSCGAEDGCCQGKQSIQIQDTIFTAKEKGAGHVGKT